MLPGASCSARPTIARMASHWRRNQDQENRDVGSDNMSETSEAVLSIEHLTLALPAGADRAFAVEDISLALHPRQILCVVGESGSGKSVCASAVMGLLPKEIRAVAGAICFEGRDLLSMPAA